jgi:hypothetical protein
MHDASTKHACVAFIVANSRPDFFSHAHHQLLSRALTSLTRAAVLASKKLLVDQIYFFVVMCAPKVATT